MEVKTEIIVAIIGVTPVVASPLLGWLVEHLGSSRRSKKVAALKERIEVVERLLGLEKHLSDEQKNSLDAELAAIASDLVADRMREHAAGKTVVERLSLLQRFFLLYEQPTRRASIYRGLFWAFLFLGFFGASAPFLTPTTGREESWALSVVVLLFYITIGLFWRSAARHQLKRVKAQAAQSQAPG